MCNELTELEANFAVVCSPGNDALGMVSTYELEMRLNGGAPVSGGCEVRGSVTSDCAR